MQPLMVPINVRLCNRLKPLEMGRKPPSRRSRGRAGVKCRPTLPRRPAGLCWWTAPVEIAEQEMDVLALGKALRLCALRDRLQVFINVNPTYRGVQAEGGGYGGTRTAGDER